MISLVNLVPSKVIGVMVAASLSLSQAMSSQESVVGSQVDLSLQEQVEVEVPHTGEVDLSQELRIELPEKKRARVLAYAPRAVRQAPASEVDHLFVEYGEEYGLDSEKLKRIAFCESGNRPEALSPSGAYGGLYQFVTGTWVSNRKAMGLDPNPELRFDAREAVRTAAFKMSRDGYGAWPVCGAR